MCLFLKCSSVLGWTVIVNCEHDRVITKKSLSAQDDMVEGRGLVRVKETEIVCKCVCVRVLTASKC